MERSIGRPMSGMQKTHHQPHRPVLTNRDIQREIPTNNAYNHNNNNSNNNNSNMNNNSSHTPSKSYQPQSYYSQQHEAIIHYINDSWNKATSEPDLAEFYYRSTNDRVPGFKPFDLEEFWGRRTFLQLTQSRGNP